MLPCPLCNHLSPLFFTDSRRSYCQCPRCELIFADPLSHLETKAEKALYDLHENDPYNAGYCRFLNRLAEPLLTRLNPGMTGLDYGCGPGPVLARLLENAGMVMTLYDPHYAPAREVLQRKYDFVTCTETVEHFRRPADDWEMLINLLRRGSWLGIMTQLAISRERFSRWQYKNDPTHVSFYTEATFAWIAWRHRLQWERIGRDVILMRK